MGRLVSILLAAGVTFCARPSWASSDPPPPTVTLLTFGPGYGVFTKFGHNALLVEHGASKRALVYNYGTFRFDSPWVALEFFVGRFRYWLSASPLPMTKLGYRLAERSMLAQELDLAPERARELEARLIENLKEENKYYAYDFFFDNCSTRLRDLVDDATEGALARSYRSISAERTFREHVLRLTARTPPLRLAVDFLIGPVADRPRSVWEEMFLPEVLHAAIRDVTIERDGTRRPLVRRKYTILEAAQRSPPPEKAPSNLPVLLISGLSLGVAAWALGRGGTGASPRRTQALGWYVGLLGAAAGLLGAILLELMIFTDHTATRWNANVLAFPPFALVLVALAPGLARGSPRALRRARFVAAACLATTLAGLLLAVSPFGVQMTSPFLAFALPLWIGIALGLRRARVMGLPAAPDLSPTDLPR
jgi:hypothetical protein